MQQLFDLPSTARIDFEHYLPKETQVRKSRDICLDFQNGLCHKSSCEFRHAFVGDDYGGRSNRPDFSSRQEVCKYWLRGLCTAGDDCQFLHEFDMKKIPPCIYHQKLGECANPECIFQHKSSEERVPRCAAYDRGFCSKGPKCTLRHVKQAVCGNYMAGFCPLGTKCKLGHPTIQFFDEDSVRHRLRLRMAEDRREGGSNLNVICDRCRDPGHIAPRCPGREKGMLYGILSDVQEPGAPPFLARGDGCHVCGEKDHMARSCPKRRGMVLPTTGMAPYEKLIRAPL